MDTARRVIRSAIHGEFLSPVTTCDDALMHPAGCFVTLHEIDSHHLRGCIGTFDAQHPLFDAIQKMALAAAMEDPRFVGHRLTEADIPNIELDISILSPLRPMNGPMDFDLQTEGLYVTFGNRSGCFLPQVARETGWNKDELLDHLCADKMGLSPLIWHNPHTRFQAFTTQTLGPEPLAPPQTP